MFDDKPIGGSIKLFFRILKFKPLTNLKTFIKSRMDPPLTKREVGPKAKMAPPTIQLQHMSCLLDMILVKNT